MKTSETSFHFIGLGGAGTNILNGFFKKRQKGKYTYITSGKREHFSSEINFIFYKPPKMKWDEVPDISKPLILPEEIKALFTANHKYVLLAGLGGYTGTYMLKEIVTLLKEENKDFLVLCTLPFAFEGLPRKQYSEQFKNLFPSFSNLKYFKNEEIKIKYGQKTFAEGFEITNNELYKLFKNETNEN